MKKILKEKFKKYEGKINSYYESNIIKAFVIWFAASSAFALNNFMGHNMFTSGRCWSFFDNCKNIFKIYSLPFSYAENIIFGTILMLILFSMYFLYNKKYSYTHVLLFIVLLFKYLILAINGNLGNFDYYDIIIQTIFFISFNKVWSLRVSFLFLYILASTIKIHEGWILGTYFTSMVTKLPFFPSIFMPIYVNIVNIMQIAGGFLSLHKNEMVRKFSIAYVLFFHIYSGTIVGFRYPITSVSLVIILFLLKDNIDSNNNYKAFSSKIIFNLKNAGVPILLSILLFFQLYPVLFIKGDQKLTFEGNNYGLYMFEANHQYISTLKNSNDDIIETWTTDAANYRISFSSELQNIKRKHCIIGDKINWTLDHSINGNPFLRIIDTNPCLIEYKSFSHNDWINIENPKNVGYARENIYGNHNKYSATYNNQDGTIGSKTLAAFPKTEKNYLQTVLYPYVKNIEIFYWVLWSSTILYIIYWATFKNKK